MRQRTQEQIRCNLFLVMFFRLKLGQFFMEDVEILEAIHNYGVGYEN